MPAGAGLAASAGAICRAHADGERDKHADGGERSAHGSRLASSRSG